MASQNVEIAKKGYEAFGAGDIETALADFDDNIEWTIPGNSTLSGTYRGKDQFKEMLGKAAEKNFTTTPERYVADGDRRGRHHPHNRRRGIRASSRCVDLPQRQSREGCELRGHRPAGTCLRRQIATISRRVPFSGRSAALGERVSCCSRGQRAAKDWASFAEDHRYVEATAKRCHSPGTPLSSCVPRSSNSSPDPPDRAACWTRAPRPARPARSHAPRCAQRSRRCHRRELRTRRYATLPAPGCTIG